jgi:hypothetical protein
LIAESLNSPSNSSEFAPAQGDEYEEMNKKFQVVPDDVEMLKETIVGKSVYDDYSEEGFERDQGEKVLLGKTFMTITRKRDLRGIRVRKYFWEKRL